MNKVLNMQGMNRVGAIHLGTIGTGRTVDSALADRSLLHLVTPDEALRLSGSRKRPAAYKRILRKHPELVDGAFVGLTLAVSALVWWASR